MAELQMYEMSTNLKSANKLRLPSRFAEVVWSPALQNLRASEAAIRWSKKYCVFDSSSSPGGENSGTEKKERQKSLSTRQRSDLQTNRLIPLVLRALMDHLLDLMLIRQETGRPPRGCSIKQPDSSWRNPAVKRTLAGKSLRRAHKKAHTSVYSHTHTHTHT